MSYLTSVNTLLQLKKELEERLRKYESVLGAVRRLPHDVLACIFEFAVDGDESEIPLSQYDALGSLDTRRAPWVLGQVCHSWRATVTSLPLLWTIFNLSGRTDTPDIRSLIHLLRFKMDRCQNTPIHVVCRELTPNLTPHSFVELCTKSSLWQDAHLEISSWAARHLKAHSGGLFYNLKELHLHAYSGDDSSLDHDVFQNAPNLRAVSIRGQNEFIESLVLPWKQLTRYAGLDSASLFITTPFHLKVLPELEKVEVCWLDCVNDDGTVETPLDLQGRIKLSFLRTLVLSMASGAREDSGIGELLDHITLPALRDLEFRVGVEDPAALIRFLERSACSLQRLSILDMVDTDVDDAVGVLSSGISSLHSVDTLVLGSKYTVTNANLVLDCLTVHPNRSIPLPALQCFHTNMYHPMKQMLDMITSRGHGSDRKVVPLGRLMLDDSPPSSDKDILHICIQEAGIEGLFSLEWKELPG
ncbi:hypothetical protein V5O48_004741 [Marasmius crinis-equi]|uniref:F-box domain-containing protein n=1 Tax=Marasmius crinis-equi TaxID=585013 RepID=A0ABR3FP90_9AGAR